MKSYLLILEELGWPNIYLITDTQFRHIDGDGLYRDHKNRRYPVGEIYYGVSACKAPVVALRHNIRGKVLKNTIYHELLHILYPWAKHWWIECAAEVLAKGGGRGYYSEKYGHTPEELPDREKLLHLIQLQVERFNRRSFAT